VSESVTGAFQLFVDEDSMFALSVAQVFTATAHLLGLFTSPHADPKTADKTPSHLYQASLRVAYQNLLLLELIAKEHRPASSPRFVVEVLSMPIGAPATLVPDFH
jgi:hypothetical protein